eukprot:8627539-Lingulodinium_polyedra.AAC.1
MDGQRHFACAGGQVHKHCTPGKDNCALPALDPRVRVADTSLQPLVGAFCQNGQQTAPTLQTQPARC